MEKKMTVQCKVARFVDRKSAKEYADRYSAKVERCPADRGNADGYFKYLVRV